MGSHWVGRRPSQLFCSFDVLAGDGLLSPEVASVEVGNEAGQGLRVGVAGLHVESDDGELLGADGACRREGDRKGQPREWKITLDPAHDRTSPAGTWPHGESCKRSRHSRASAPHGYHLPQSVRQYRAFDASVIALALAVILVRWFDLETWKVGAVVLPTAVSALLFPGQPLIPFAVAAVGLSAVTSTSAGEAGDWFAESWKFAKQILPLLLVGVLIAGILLGRPGEEGLIPSAWVSGAVGGNSLFANLFASVAGAFMYFATLTEVPILQGLIGNGMGAGPALALLLAGPALSLPNMLVVRSVLGTRKTLAYVALVVVMSTVAGLIYGTISG